MKSNHKIKMRASILALIFIIQLTATFSVIAQTDLLPLYNAYDDYTTVTQSSVWNYQEASGGISTNLAWDTANSFWHTNAYVSTNQDIYMTGQNTIWFHPGPAEDSVVTFTAPDSGTIIIKSASESGVAVADNSADGILFTIKKGSSNLFAPTIITKNNRVTNGNNIDFNITTTVSAGDKIQFIVGRNVNNGGDSTYVTPVIEYTQVAQGLPSYNARTGYTTVTQSGVWNYQELSGGTYSNLAWDGASSYWHTNAYLNTNQDIYMTGQNTIWFHPGPTQDSVLTFTAPESGAINIKSASGYGVAVGDDSADGILFTIKNGNTNIFAPTVITKSNRVTSGSNIDFDIVTPVSAGDKIHFIVGGNGNNSGDATYVTPVITYTAIDEGSGDLYFLPGSQVEASEITRTGFTLNWPAAETGLQSVITYTAYISDAKITQIPTGGGISAGTARTCKFTDLSLGQSYYVAIVARNTNGNEVLLTKDGKITTVYPSYNARSSYTKVTQPGLWSYLETSGSGYTTLSWKAENTYWHTDAYVSTNTDIYMTGQDTMYFHPGVSADSVVAFTAPYSGSIIIKSASGYGIAVGDDSADGILFTIKKGASNIFPTTEVTKNNRIANGNNIDFNISTTVKAGDKIYFIVGKKGANNGDATYVTPLITYTEIKEGSGELFFLPGSKIEATNITKTGFTVNWVAAQTSLQSPITNTVYISSNPITQIPTNGGIKTGALCTYSFSNLNLGQDYYVAVVARNTLGDVALLLREEKITTVFPSYNAYEDFTKSVQSGSIWRYQVGYPQGETYVTENLQWNKEAGYWGSAELSLINSATSDLVTGNPSLAVHPGPNARDAVVVFIAPYTGTIDITMANGGIFAPMNGTAQSFGGINFKLTKGSKTLYSKEAISSKNSNPESVRSFADKLTVQVKKGDRLNFIVNANKATDNDSTYFNPFINYTQITGGSPSTSDTNNVQLLSILSAICLTLVLITLHSRKKKTI